MAIIQDGSQAFGIQASPIEIDSVFYVMESASFNYSASRADLNDSNGEPLASTIVPGRIEGSATLQLASSTTDPDLVGSEFTLSGTRTDGDYYITSSSEAQSQGDYVKVSIDFYQKIN